MIDFELRLAFDRTYSIVVTTTTQNDNDTRPFFIERSRKEAFGI